ncbi:MFS transporter [Romboutsia weinsteinii]|uniref:MFS transporter n=1 Tax=Romboutsia weinsteinii TaxID=2020949 RepID=A0A371J6A6_9FIRM|nr:MFS transporter [Romboutsia weinsteinii]RDY28264.1 MFS transporter [Romboutsia weinsteinii]
MNMNNNWKYKFLTIWFGQSISFLTSAVLQMALIWHLSVSTESAAILSFASIVAFLPNAVLGLFAGTLVDRWNKKIAMIGADLFIATVSLALAIYGLYAEIPIWLVLVILFVRSIGTSIHTPAINAVTPLIVPEDKLTKCSGYTQTVQSIGYMAGVAIAAILYPICSLSTIVMFDVVGAVFASITTSFVKIPSNPTAQRQEKTNLLLEMKEGFNVIRKNEGVFALICIGAIFMFIYSPINALFPLITLGHFNGSTMHASITEVTFSIGMLIGGMVLGVWGGFKNRGYTIVSAIALMGVAITLSGILPSSGFWIFAVLCIVMGFAVSFYSGPQVALIQEKIDIQYLGRVFGFFGSVTSFAMPAGLILSGLFADKLGVNNWFILCGIACISLAVVSLCFKSVRNTNK